MSSGSYRQMQFDFFDKKNQMHNIFMTIDGTGAIYNIAKGAENPIQFGYRGGDKTNWDETFIHGQELTFTFYIPQEDRYVIDDLLDSEYMDWKIQYGILGENYYFYGFLKPENIYIQYENTPPQIEIQLTFTDGLAELKNTSFQEFIPELVRYDNYYDDYSLLEVIKYALTPVSRSLDFMIQLGTYETTIMTLGQCPLKEIYCGGKAFYEKEGNNQMPTKPKTCWDVLENVLKLFNLKLHITKQAYYITNYHEGASTIFRYDWTTLALISSSASVNVIDISNNYFIPYVEQQRIQPLRSITATVSAQDYGEDVVDIGTDLWDWNNWTITFDSWIDGDDSAFKASPEPDIYGYGWVKLTDNSGWDVGKDVMTFGTPFTIEKTSDNQFIKLEFVAAILDIDVTDGAEVQIKIKIKRPSQDDWSEATEVIAVLQKNMTLYFQSDASSTYEPFRITESGEYELKISFEPNRYVYGDDFTWGNLTILFGQIQIRKYDGNHSDTGGYYPFGSDFTKTFRQSNLKGVEDIEMSFLFSDNTRKDISSSLFNANGSLVSERWRSVDGSVAQPIIDLCLRTILLNRSRYKNFIKCTIIDEDQLLDINKVILMKGILYAFNTFVKESRTGNVEAELVELIINSSSEDVTTDDYEDFTPIVTKSAKIIGSTNVKNEYYQEEHLFSIGDVIRYDVDSSGRKFHLAQAIDTERATAIGIVTDIINDNVFRYESEGLIQRDKIEYILTQQGLTYEVGKYYYLSALKSGQMTMQSTYEDFGVEQAVGYATEKGFVVNIDARNLDMESIITNTANPRLLNFGIPYYMYDEESTFPDSSDIDSSGDIWNLAKSEVPSAGATYIEIPNLLAGDGEVLVHRFITMPERPGLTFIQAGAWVLSTWVSASSITYTCYVKINVYRFVASSSGEDTILPIFSTQNLIKSDTVTEYFKMVVVDGLELNETDQLLFEYIFENTGNSPVTLKLWYQGMMPTYVRLPIPQFVPTPDNQATVNTDMSVTGDGKEDTPITLVNDEDDPGADKYYGTNENGTKGYYDLPEIIGGINGAVTNVKYGNLYNAYVLADSRGIAPAGFRIPTIDDFKELSDYLDSDGDYMTNNTVGGKLKETGFTHWLTPNTGALNSVGFNARGAGIRAKTGGFGYQFYRLYLWADTPVDELYPAAEIYYNDEYCWCNGATVDSMKYGFSLRYVCDDSSTYTESGFVTGNDGKVYPLIKIGNQIWTSCNIAETKFSNGDDIDGPIFTNGEWAALTTPAYCTYEDSEENAVDPTGSTIQHNLLGGLQGGGTAERYHHTEEEINTHVYEAPEDDGIYARVNGEWVKIGEFTSSGESDYLEDNYVDSANLSVDDEGEMPAIDNTNNVIKLTLGRTGSLPDFNLLFGSMAGFKLWHGDASALPSTREEDTIYFVNEEETSS